MPKGAPADAVVWEEVEARTSRAGRAVRGVPGLHAPGGADHDHRHLPGLRDPDRGRDGRRPRVRADRGPLRGARAAPPRAGAALGRRARGRLPCSRSSPSSRRRWLFKETGSVADETFDQSEHGIANIIASPDFFAFLVAACAGAAGMLSLSTAKSGALIGVLISVTTIPAAANIGVTAAYGDWDNSSAARVAQLALQPGRGSWLVGDFARCWAVAADRSTGRLKASRPLIESRALQAGRPS